MSLYLATDAGEVNPSQEPGTPAWLSSTQTTKSSSHSPSYDRPADHLGQTTLGLIAIVLLILGLGYLIKRLSRGSYRLGQRLRVVDSLTLGRREKIVVVELENKRWVLGVTQHQINLIDSAPPATEPEQATGSTAGPTQPMTFNQALAQNLKKAIERLPTRR